MSSAGELRGLAAGLRARLEVSDVIEFSLGADDAPRTTGSVKGSPVATSTDKAAALEKLREQVRACRKCPLGGQRLNPAFGVGSPDAAVMFVGEGPGFEEDRRGEPFVGRAGQLLDKILASIGLSRQTQYIANIVKCHPMKDPTRPDSRGNDRPPHPEESAACIPYLEEQIRIISPRVIVTLGSVATRTLLGEEVPISKVRGLWREYRKGLGGRGIKLLPTYHPAALLRNPELKRDVWSDMKSLKKELAAHG